MTLYSILCFHLINTLPASNHQQNDHLVIKTTNKSKEWEVSHYLLSRLCDLCERWLLPLSLPALRLLLLRDEL